MKWFAFFVVFLCILQSTCWGQGRVWCDRDNIRERTISRLFETDVPYDTIKVNYEKLLWYAESAGDEMLQTECLFQLAHIQYMQSYYSKSLAGTKRGLEIACRLNDNDMMAVGYDLLGRLHYLLSPEQAKYYYQKSWYYCGLSDSIELATAGLNSYILVRSDYVASLDDLLSIDIDALSGLTRARLSFLIARSLVDIGNIGDALEYLSDTGKYLEQYNDASPLDLLYAQQMAKMMLIEGDIRKAQEYWDKSHAIARRNKQPMEQVNNYKIASEIAQAGAYNGKALEYYKKSIALRDSIFSTVINKNLPDELLSTMMEYVHEDMIKKKEKFHTILYAILVLALIAGICLLYYHKSKQYREKEATAMSNIKEQTAVGFHSRLKNHLMKIMYSYKAGVSFCLKNVLKEKIQTTKADSVYYSSVLEKHMDKADEFLDMLFGWVESNPDMQPEHIDFDAGYMVEQLVNLHEIAFAFKHFTYKISVGKVPMILHADKVMMAIALEHLFFRMATNAPAYTTILVSAGKNENGQFVFSISNSDDKQRTMEKEIFPRLIETLKTGGITRHTADWDFNIFEVCLRKNRAKAWFEFIPATGTTYGLTLPGK